jgi:ATP-dependent RNA helicase RhlE
MTSSFSNLSLAEPLARAVAEMGYETMTPIQEQAIPVVLSGQDVMGAAQTGTGKTAAFSLPLLQRMLKHEKRLHLARAASGARARAAAHA